MPAGRKGRSELADLWLTPCRLQGTASRSDSAICAEYAMLMSGWCSLCVAEVQVAGASARGGCDACGWCCSGGVEADFDADGVGGVGEGVGGAGGGSAGGAGGRAAVVRRRGGGGAFCGGAGGVVGGGVGFLGGGFGEPGGHGLACLGGRCLDRFLDLGGCRDRQFPCGHAC